MRLPRSGISLLLALLVPAQSVLAAQAEANLWSERRAAARTARPPLQLAALPRSSFSGPILPSSVHAPLPLVPSTGSPPLDRLVAAIPHSDATIRDVHNAGADRPAVAVLQDVHLNAEAQIHLAATIERLAAEGGIDLIGVEGAFHRFDFSRFRAFPLEIRRRVVPAFLTAGRLAAPSYAGILSERPLPPMIGVDDLSEHGANVAAYLEAKRVQDVLRRSLAARAERARTERARLFPLVLRELDRLAGAYRSGSLSLGRYVQALSRHADAPDPHVDRFLRALEMEMRLDIGRVEAERRHLFERLTGVLSDAECRRLLSESEAYRDGRMGFGAFHRSLTSTLAVAGISMERTPAFRDYLAYVALSDSIEPAPLMEAVSRLERRVFDRLAATPDLKERAAEARRLDLERKLLEFHLTPSEWRDLRSFDFGPDMKPFLAFYRAADRRSRRMTDALLRATDGNRVLVTGGFHTPDVCERLKQAGLSYVVVTPRLTRVEKNGGSAYLAAFAREKSPLDRLFDGDRLFVNPDHLPVGTPHRPARTSTIALLGVLAALTAAADLTFGTEAGVSIARLGETLYRASVAGFGPTISFLLDTGSVTEVSNTVALRIANVSILAQGAPALQDALAKPGVLFWLAFYTTSVIVAVLSRWRMEARERREQPTFSAPVELPSALLDAFLDSNLHRDPHPSDLALRRSGIPEDNPRVLSLIRFAIGEAVTNQADAIQERDETQALNPKAAAKRAGEQVKISLQRAEDPRRSDYRLIVSGPGEIDFRAIHDQVPYLLRVLEEILRVNVEHDYVDSQAARYRESLTDQDLEYLSETIEAVENYLSLRNPSARDTLDLLFQRYFSTKVEEFTRKYLWPDVFYRPKLRGGRGLGLHLIGQRVRPLKDLGLHASYGITVEEGETRFFLQIGPRPERAQRFRIERWLDVLIELPLLPGIGVLGYLLGMPPVSAVILSTLVLPVRHLLIDIQASQVMKDAFPSFFGRLGGSFAISLISFLPFILIRFAQPDPGLIAGATVVSAGLGFLLHLWWNHVAPREWELNLSGSGRPADEIINRILSPGVTGADLQRLRKMLKQKTTFSTDRTAKLVHRLIELASGDNRALARAAARALKALIFNAGTTNQPFFLETKTAASLHLGSAPAEPAALQRALIVLALNAPDAETVEIALDLLGQIPESLFTTEILPIVGVETENAENAQRVAFLQLNARVKTILDLLEEKQVFSSVTTDTLDGLLDHLRPTRAATSTALLSMTARALDKTDATIFTAKHLRACWNFRSTPVGLYASVLREMEAIQHNFSFGLARGAWIGKVEPAQALADEALRLHVTVLQWDPLETEEWIWPFVFPILRESSIYKSGELFAAYERLDKAYRAYVADNRTGGAEAKLVDAIRRMNALFGPTSHSRDFLRLELDPDLGRLSVRMDTSPAPALKQTGGAEAPYRQAVRNLVLGSGSVRDQLHQMASHTGPWVSPTHLDYLAHLVRRGTPYAYEAMVAMHQIVLAAPRNGRSEQVRDLLWALYGTQDAETSHVAVQVIEALTELSKSIDYEPSDIDAVVESLLADDQPDLHPFRMACLYVVLGGMPLLEGHHIGRLSHFRTMLNGRSMKLYVQMKKGEIGRLHAEAQLDANREEMELIQTILSRFEKTASYEDRLDAIISITDIFLEDPDARTSSAAKIMSDDRNRIFRSLESEPLQPELFERVENLFLTDNRPDIGLWILHRVYSHPQFLELLPDRIFGIILVNLTNDQADISRSSILFLEKITEDPRLKPVSAFQYALYAGFTYRALAPYEIDEEGELFFQMLITDLASRATSELLFPPAVWNFFRWAAAVQFSDAAAEEARDALEEEGISEPQKDMREQEAALFDTISDHLGRPNLHRARHRLFARLHSLGKEFVDVFHDFLKGHGHMGTWSIWSRRAVTRTGRVASFVLTFGAAPVIRALLGRISRATGRSPDELAVRWVSRWAEPLVLTAWTLLAKTALGSDLSSSEMIAIGAAIHVLYALGHISGIRVVNDADGRRFEVERIKDARAPPVLSLLRHFLLGVLYHTPLLIALLSPSTLSELTRLSPSLLLVFSTAWAVLTHTGVDEAHADSSGPDLAEPVLRRQIPGVIRVPDGGAREPFNEGRDVESVRTSLQRITESLPINLRIGELDGTDQTGWDDGDESEKLGQYLDTVTTAANAPSSALLIRTHGALLRQAYTEDPRMGYMGSLGNLFRRVRWDMGDAGVVVQHLEPGREEAQLKAARARYARAAHRRPVHVVFVVDDDIPMRHRRALQQRLEAPPAGMNAALATRSEVPSARSVEAWMKTKLQFADAPLSSCDFQVLFHRGMAQAEIAGFIGGWDDPRYRFYVLLTDALNAVALEILKNDLSVVDWLETVKRGLANA